MQTLKPSTVRTLVWLAVLPYLAGGAIFLTSSIRASEAPTTAEPTSAVLSNGSIGEIRMFAGNFAPRGWAFCDGRLLAISQNSALFSILGTTYGGDGRTSFALPDMRGRVAIHPGAGPGLTSRQLGQKLGAERLILNQAQLPGHSHNGSVTINTTKGTLTAANPTRPSRPSGLSVGQSGLHYQQEGNGISLTKEKFKMDVGATGNSQPISLMQPSIGINYIICLQGTFPSRN